jgi:hypothetical protein
MSLYNMRGSASREESFIDQPNRALGQKDIADYDSIVSNPLATCYIAYFMHRTGLLAQFQNVEKEEYYDQLDSPTGLFPEDARYQPISTTTVEEGESLDSLLEYTLPEWAITDNVEHLIKDEARAATNGI